nr:MAG TPA: hypothetical protein [Caudoviricetes sp.]
MIALERHHIFGGPNRTLSERYGLVVPLVPQRAAGRRTLQP